jgi:uncharacterized membrane protein
MPYCTQCGQQVGPADRFCGSCGTQQAPPPAAGEAAGASAGKSSASSSGPAAGTAHGAFPRATSAGQNVEDALSKIDARTASILCYIPFAGWVAAIVVLASARFRDDRTVRFHAFQGLYLFVVWLFVDWVFAPAVHFAESTRSIADLMKLAVLGTWIWMIIKTSQNVLFRLPFIGELADRSVSEQK